MARRPEAGFGRRRRRGAVLGAWVATLVAALALTGVLGAPAQALPLPGTITGTVTTISAVPVQDISVHAYDVTTGEMTNWHWTAADGTYSFEVPPGTYRVDFDASTAGYAYAAEYYDDALDMDAATPVVVAAGATVSGIDAQLDLAASVCGSVTDGFGNPPTGAFMGLNRVDGTWSTGAIVQADGTYCYLGLKPGDYRLLVHGEGYVTQWWQGAATEGAATIITLAPGQNLTGITTVLDWTSGIRGTVTGPTGLPVADAIVVVTAPDGGPDIAWVTTAADGTYSMSLPPGAHRLSFVPPDDALWAQWYDGALTPTDADPVTVVADQYTLGVDAHLTLPMTFSDVVPGSVFYDDIMWLVDQRVTLGFPDGTFRRTPPVSREAMAAFLHRLAGGLPSGSVEEPPSFTDVSLGNPFHDDIIWLAQEGVTTGFPDGSFHPSASVERQAMAAFLYRYAGSPTFTPPAVSPFADVHPGDPFYAEICWLADRGISTGTVTASGAYFKPLAPVERQAMAAFVHRLWSNVLAN